MKIKSIVSAVVVACAFGAGAATVAKQGMLKDLSSVNKLLTSTQKSKVKFTTLQDRVSQDAYFKTIEEHADKKLYIVRLKDAPVTTYSGGIKEFAATKIVQKRLSSKIVKFDSKSYAAKKYANYLEKQQDNFLSKASSKLGGQLSKLKSLKYAINGLVTKLTYAEAATLSSMPEVAFVEQNEISELNTDTGPEFIGAGAVWDGTSGASEYMGDGIVVGIIDTGVNTDHRSFAATGDDDYTVVNPFGENVYVGDCVADATLCNSKLIGVRSYPAVLDYIADNITDIPAIADVPAPTNGEDHGGHGSHTASTSAGNVLIDVSLTINDPTQGSAGDGFETSTVFPRMSGVAPHANVISYQSCLPGSPGDALSGCFSAAGIGAIDDAIADGVDVINYSIGGTTQFSPWTSATELGFLSAQAAGIFVATSAGNSGPNPSTTTKASPWYTAVAASSHNRTVNIEHALTVDGVDFDMAASIGPVIPNAGSSAPMIYAGALNAENFEGCTDFAADAFIDSIALISRGSCAFTAKINNAAAAGADAVVIFNNAGGDELTSVLATGTTIPSAFISENSGATVVESLTATPGLTASLARTITVEVGEGDVMAGFSSRGPNAFSGIITPQIAAPGRSVYAAYADDTPYNDANGPDPRDFAFLGGTSMASPHIAGSAALVMQAHPTWNPDHVRSALMMTATTAVLKEDGETPADALDIGAGRVQVDKAINAGLIMSEIEANYLAADPSAGGDPTSLNIPSMANYACNTSCEWTRVFEVVSAGTYTVTGGSSAMTMEPSSFVAEAGDLVSIDFTLDVTGAPTGENTFDSVTITSTGQPDLHLPVYAIADNGEVPDDVTITVGRNNGSWLVSGLNTIETENLHFDVDGIYDLNATGLTEVLPFELGQDPTIGTIAGLLDFNAGGLFHYPVEIPANTASVNVSISDSTSPDNDLFLFRDSDNNGSYDALIGQYATALSDESGSFANPAAGSYLVVVQNYAASSADAIDTGNLTVEVVPTSDPLPGLSVVAPISSSGAVDIRLVWDIAMEEGDSWGADITAYIGDSEKTGKIGTFNVVIDRVVDDFTATANRSLVERGERIEYTLKLNSSPYQEAMDYSVAIDMPENMTLLEGSVEGGGVITLNGDQGFNWEVSSIVPVDNYIATNSVDDASCAAADWGYFSLQDANGPGSFAPIDFHGDTINTKVFAGINFPLFGENHDGVTITDDGFVVFAGTPGSSPWTNAAIPSEAEPNSMIAMLWNDLQLFDDGSGNRGVRIASLGGNNRMIQFDKVGSFDVDADEFSFNLYMFPDATDAAGDYEYIVAYSDTQVGDLSGAVAGIENADGTKGVDASSMIAPGVQICYDYNVIVSEPAEVKFTVVTQPGYSGQTAAPNVTVNSSMALSEDYSFRAAPVEFVNVAPVANAGSDLTLDRAEPPTLVILSAAGSSDLDGDTLSFSWEQVDGETVVLTGANDDVTHFNFASAANGVYRFRVTASDGSLSSTDEVSVTISGKDKSSGSGSMGMLLLLLVGSMFTRKKIFK